MYIYSFSRLSQNHVFLGQYINDVFCFASNPDSPFFWRASVTMMFQIGHFDKQLQAEGCQGGATPAFFRECLWLFGDFVEGVRPPRLVAGYSLEVTCW